MGELNLNDLVGKNDNSELVVNTAPPQMEAGEVLSIPEISSEMLSFTDFLVKYTMPDNCRRLSININDVPEDTAIFNQLIGGKRDLRVLYKCSQIMVPDMAPSSAAVFANNTLMVEYNVGVVVVRCYIHRTSIKTFILINDNNMLMPISTFNQKSADDFLSVGFDVDMTSIQAKLAEAFNDELVIQYQPANKFTVPTIGDAFNLMIENWDASVDVAHRKLIDQVITTWLE